MAKRWKCSDKGCKESFDTFEELETHHKYVDKVNKHMEKTLKILGEK